VQSERTPEPDFQTAWKWTTGGFLRGSNMYWKERLTMDVQHFLSRAWTPFLDASIAQHSSRSFAPNSKVSSLLGLVRTPPGTHSETPDLRRGL